MADHYLLGIDVGTSSVKAALFDTSGQAVRTFSATYATARPRPHHVEQRPEDWTDLVLAALTQLTDGIRPGAILAAGLCSQVNTHVFVDSSGNALFPAITWQDGRSAAEAKELDAKVAQEKRLKWWAAPLPIDASHVLARMAHMAKHHPEIWAKTRWVLVPKDYCLLKLTGRAIADPLSSFGVIDQNLNYIAELIDLVPGAAERLPPLHGITAPVGRIRNGLPGAGIPLVATTMDAWTALIGAGVVAEGDAGYLSGTSEVGAIVAKRKVPTPGVIAFPPCEGIVMHAGPTQAGGASISWVANLLGVTAQDVSTLAARAKAAAGFPVFLPHLQGERAPLWDINARGAFAGLDSAMGPPELARAVMEGVAYSVRLLLESLEHSAGKKVELLKHAGGGAGSDVWCQIRADVLKRRIARMKVHDAGVLGASMFAGVGSGVFASLAEASAHLVSIERVFEPKAERAAIYDDGFARYRDLYARLKGFTG